MKEYNVYNISNKSLIYFKSCFDNNGSPKSTDKILWQFLEGTVDKQFVDIAVDKKSDITAATYAIFPIKFLIGSEVLLASQSLDTMTDVKFRGKGLFIKLAKSVYEKAIHEDVKLVYGFPNGNSIYGFERKLDWVNLDPVPFLIKPLKTKYFSKRIKLLSFMPNFNLISKKKNISSGNYYINDKVFFPQEVDEIWRKFSKGIKVSIDRNRNYLIWRYINKPLENYRVSHVYSKSDDQYLGFIVYVTKEKHGGKIGYIMETIYDITVDGLGDFLMKYAINEINKSNADCILSWCFEHSPNYLAHKRQGFLKMPEKLRPIELHFGVRTFDEKYSNLIENRNNWYLSYSDSDTV